MTSASTSVTGVWVGPNTISVWDTSVVYVTKATIQPFGPGYWSLDWVKAPDNPKRGDILVFNGKEWEFKPHKKDNLYD
jgi:hypothetical protein